METVAWITQVSQCNYKSTYKMDAGKLEKRQDEEAEIGVMCFE